MPVTRINEFQAQEGRGDDLRQLLASFIPTIESAPGCISCQLLKSQGDPDRLVVIEVWESVEAHQAATQDIPPEALQDASQLMARTPQGDYFS